MLDMSRTGRLLGRDCRRTCGATTCNEVLVMSHPSLPPSRNAILIFLLNYFLFLIYIVERIKGKTIQTKSARKRIAKESPHHPTTIHPQVPKSTRLSCVARFKNEDVSGRIPWAYQDDKS